MNGVMDRMWNLQPKFSGILSDCTGSDPVQPRIAVNPNNKSPILEGFSSTFLVKLVMVYYWVCLISSDISGHMCHGKVSEIRLIC